MGKQDRKNDGVYSKLIVAAVVVTWVSLVGGNWLGHYLVEKGVLGPSARQEYRPATQAKPKPWITVDPAQQQELERLQGRSAQEEEKLPTPEATSAVAPSASATPEEPIETASPVVEETAPPAPEVTPLDSEVTATPGEPLPTPAEVGDTYHLQFGSFANRENAQAMVESLRAVGQDSEVEEIDGGSGKTVYRVRGGAYTEEQARIQRDKLREQNFQAFIVNSQ